MPAAETSPAEPAVAGSGGQQGSRLRQLFANGAAVTTLGFWTATFMAMVLIYGTSTWLPTLMVNSGYDLNSALEFAVTFNIGAIVGTLSAALIAGRLSVRWATAMCFGVAFLAMFVLTTPQPRLLLLLMAALAGMGSHGTQAMINAFISGSYPARLRGTALGFSLGVGRLGAIAGPSYLAAVVVLITIPDAGFYAFMVPAVLGAIVVALIPARRQATLDAPAAEPPAPVAERVQRPQ